MTDLPVKYNGSYLFRNASDPMAAVNELGRVFASSGMFGLKTPEQGAIFALTCVMENKTPMEIMRLYHMVQGRPTMRSDAMHAEFLNAGGRVRWARSDAEVCTITLTHPDYAPDGIELTVTRKEFDESGLTRGKDNWKNYPKRMLQCRAISAGVRQVMPQIVAGIYTPEEADDFVDAEFSAEPAQRVSPVEVKRLAQPEPKQQEEATKPASALQGMVDRCIASFNSIGVNSQRLETRFGASATWTKETLKKLKTLLDNIKAGHATAGNEFPFALSSYDIDAACKKFAPYAIIPSDLESWLGSTFEPPRELVPIGEWTKTELAKLDYAASEIISSEDPVEAAKVFFGLEPGAHG